MRAVPLYRLRRSFVWKFPDLRPDVVDDILQATPWAFEIFVLGGEDCIRYQPEQRDAPILRRAVAEVNDFLIENGPMTFSLVKRHLLDGGGDLASYLTQTSQNVFQ